MKNLVGKFSIALLSCMLIFTALNAQSRYKHVPRVKVDRKKTENVMVSIDANLQTPVNNNTMALSEVEITANVLETSPAIEYNEVATTSKYDQVIIVNKHQSALHQPSEKINRKADKNYFTEKVKTNSKLLDVKDVAKTNMETALLVMILLYIVGTILLIVGLVMLFLLLGSLTAALVLIIAGGVLLIAASVMLTLFKMGVF